MANPPAKICIRCGQDCSGRPRTRDRDGNYTCRTCFDEMEWSGAAAQRSSAARPAAAAAYKVTQPPPSAEDNPAILAALLDGERVACAHACAACGNTLPPEGIICVNCGFNRATGARVNTREVSPPRPPRRRRARRETSPGEGGGALEILTSPVAAFLGLLLIYIVAYALAMSDPSGIPIFLIFFLFMTFAAALYQVIAAFVDDDTGWGICGLCAMFFPCAQILFWLATLYYIFAISDRPYLKAVYAVVLISILMFFSMYLQHTEEIDELFADP